MKRSVPAGNADELFALALQADATGCKSLAYMICLQITAIEPSHPGVRRFLNHVRFDSRWMTFDEAVAKAETLLESGRLELLLGRLLPELMAQSDTTARRLAVGNLTGRAQIQSGQFAAAGKIYADMSAMAPAPACHKYAAMAELLTENPDGMYLLAEPYPGAAAILGQGGRHLVPGPVSLKDNLAMEASLHDKAAEAMAEAIKAITKAARNPQVFVAAQKAFDKADAIYPNISRSYRIELAAARAAELRGQAQLDLKAFNHAVEALGQTAMDAGAYHGMLVGLLTALEGIAAKLVQASEIIKPHAKEAGDLPGQIARDLSGLENIRSTLKAELHDK
ncbi:MAG: hypothetical protein HZA50_15900 [Planctomycetes bacterium]|nr:hypothetical protein [Planctomycetota bacterium]